MNSSADELPADSSQRAIGRPSSKVIDPSTKIDGRATCKYCPDYTKGCHRTSSGAETLQSSILLALKDAQAYFAASSNSKRRSAKRSAAAGPCLPDRKKQTLIAGHVRSIAPDRQQSQLDRALLLFTVMCGVPFNVVENPFLIAFIQLLRPSYKLPSITTTCTCMHISCFHACATSLGVISFCK
jgi:hypothetical protein